MSGKIPRLVSWSEAAIGGEGDPFSGEEVYLFPERGAGGFAGVSADAQIMADNAVAGNAGCERIPAERLTYCPAGTAADEFGQQFISGDASARNE
jgi:hypothetical protein